MEDYTCCVASRSCICPNAAAKFAIFASISCASVASSASASGSDELVGGAAAPGLSEPGVVAPSIVCDGGSRLFEIQPPRSAAPRPEQVSDRTNWRIQPVPHEVDAHN